MDLNSGLHPRRSWVKTLLLLLALPLTSIGAIKPEIAKITLTASEAIKWDDQKGKTLDALKIDADASIILWHCSDITITTCQLHSIELADCQRITIRNCWIHDSKRIAIAASASQQITVQGCRLENVCSGLYVENSQGIQVIGNFTRNVKGPFPRGQMVQFDNVRGPGNVIRGNYAINDAGKSCPEDVINIYMSHGEAKSPILVEDNYLLGDATKGSEGKSKTGSGIMLADCGGAHQVCRRNVIVDAGQVGLGVAGGTDIRVEDNLVLGGKSQVSNSGLYVWNQSKAPSSHIRVARNRVQWINNEGENTSWWDGGGSGPVELIDNHFADATLAKAIPPPPPPSQAPMPPQPWVTLVGGKPLIRLPW